MLREIGRVLDRRDHPLDGEESGQVRRVRRDDDQREKPPDSAYYPRAGSLVKTIDTPLLLKPKPFISREQFLLVSWPLELAIV